MLYLLNCFTETAVVKAVIIITFRGSPVEVSLACNKGFSFLLTLFGVIFDF